MTLQSPVKPSCLPDFAHETRLTARGHAAIAGVDEAGRGPLAGPVAVAAVILDGRRIPAGLDDSKRLTPAVRARLFDIIVAEARAISIVVAPAAVIDGVNIRAATLAAMARAVAALVPAADYVLVDGRDVPPLLAVPALALVRGDAICASIAAASIVAKVTRDRLMARLDAHAPHYGFVQHMGYGTSAHLEALSRHGVSQWHRLSFAPCRAAWLRIS